MNYFRSMLIAFITLVLVTSVVSADYSSTCGVLEAGDAIGIIEFTISDNNGPVGYRQVNVQLFDNTTGNSLGDAYTSYDGQVNFNVVPGVYKAKLTYLLVSSQPSNVRL